MMAKARAKWFSTLFLTIDMPVTGGRDHYQKIQTVVDAVRAKEYSVYGVVLSNRGGRQLDSAISPLEILPDVVSTTGKDYGALSL